MFHGCSVSLGVISEQLHFRNRAELGGVKCQGFEASRGEMLLSQVGGRTDTYIALLMSFMYNDNK